MTGWWGPGEGCDDGNDDPTDQCIDCQPASCGDGVLQEGERCDDGNETDTDGCLSTCAPAACGDGVIWQGVEACDDGNTVPTDACLEGLQRRCAAMGCCDEISPQKMTGSKSATMATKRTATAAR